MATHSNLLYTPRLALRLNDPDDEADCQTVIRFYNDDGGGRGGNSRVGLNTPEDVRTKHLEHGPRADYCTRSAPPKGLYHFVYLRDREAENEIGDLIGCISMSFRKTMPWPDIGYGFFERFWGKGYGSEAGRKALKWWQEVVGVKEVWTGALEKNIRSQRCAENIGFVRCGEFEVCFGVPGEETWSSGLAFVLPGMDWSKAFRDDGGKPFVRATVGVETESQKKNPIKFGEYGKAASEKAEGK